MRPLISTHLESIEHIEKQFTYVYVDKSAQAYRERLYFLRLLLPPNAPAMSQLPLAQLSRLHQGYNLRMGALKYKCKSQLSPANTNSLGMPFCVCEVPGTVALAV